MGLTFRLCSTALAWWRATTTCASTTRSRATPRHLAGTCGAHGRQRDALAATRCAATRLSSLPIRHRRRLFAPPACKSLALPARARTILVLPLPHRSARPWLLSSRRRVRQHFADAQLNASGAVSLLCGALSQLLTSILQPATSACGRVSTCVQLIVIDAQLGPPIPPTTPPPPPCDCRKNSPWCNDPLCAQSTRAYTPSYYEPTVIAEVGTGGKAAATETDVKFSFRGMFRGARRDSPPSVPKVECVDTPFGAVCSTH